MSQPEILVPALSLPYELISEIFILCLPLHRRVRPGRKRAPLLLAQICGHWRSIALATPELWRSIYLEFPIDFPYDGISTLFGIRDLEPVPDHTCALFALWITRAAGQSLSITIICPSSRMSLPNGLLEMVAANSAQCGRLELQITKQDMRLFDHVAVDQFPLLQSLCIHITNDYGHLRSLGIISRCKSLQAIHLRDSLSSSPGNFEWLPTSLTSLHLANIHISQVDEVALIFDRFPHLLHLSLHSYLHRQQAQQPITAPRLKSLLLLGSPQILDVFTIPTLEHLEVRLWYEADTHFLSFLARSAPHLTHLTLECNWPDTALASSLEAVPNLPTLELLFSNSCANTAGYAIMQRPALVPHLRTLIITDVADAPDFAPFLAVLRARPTLVHAELHVRPRHTSPLDLPLGEVRAGLEALLHGGLRVRVTTPNSAWPQTSWGETDPDAVGNLDYDVFGSHKTQPYFFSPF
ncbi:hypothetical protein B0H19DRAFT_1257534 [Mycena capillaripes]|nr:hypothetical protein B0H19DRAFT_1257534 [Mycena capillaripes]